MPAKRKPTAPHGQYKERETGNTFGGHGHRSHDGPGAGRSRGEIRDNKRRRGRVSELREGERFEGYDGPPVKGFRR